MTIDSAVTMLAERTASNGRDIRQANLQRRNQVVDLFGVESTRQGDANNPAEFRISVSQDLIYYERFEFKLIVQSFALPVAGGGTTSPTATEISPTSLSASGGAVSPNPHSHTSAPHTHAVTPGISLFQSHLTNAEIWLDGVDITSLLKAQHGGAWIGSEGMYPGDGFINYDILGIVDKLSPWQRGIALKPGYKKLEVRGDGIFNVTLVNYLKYSHILR